MVKLQVLATNNFATEGGPVNMSRSAALTKRFRDWPALMKPSTARDYLDGMAANKFVAVVVPHLEARFVGGELRYTRKSIDDWIDDGHRAGEAQTSDALGRLIDGDDMAEGGKAVR
jgi:hypothetical protein